MPTPLLLAVLRERCHVFSQLVGNIIVFIVHGLFIIPIARQLAILYSYMLHACCVNVLLSLSVHRAIELANSLQVSEAVAIPQVEHSSDFVSEFSVYWMGKSLFDLREYRRVAHALRLCKSDEAFFLKCYSLYLVGGVYRWYHYSVFDTRVQLFILVAQFVALITE